MCDESDADVTNCDKAKVAAHEQTQIDGGNVSEFTEETNYDGENYIPGQ